MDNRIEQEVNKTMGCMGGDRQIDVSDDFSSNLNNRIADIRISRTAGFTGRKIYPVFIGLAVILNIAILLASFSKDTAEDTTEINTLASEYGITEMNY